jgi:AcrR family transcriptional regulator
MATPKKQNKIRDYDRTRKRMLEIVGEVLKDTGFGGLRTNNIARRLGKDKKLIRYYFNSLYNLEKEFIIENDHWLSYLKQLELPPDIDERQVKDLFAEFTSAHFDFFLKSTEMQKVMLWQLTEKNPLLKSIADYRETEAGRLLSAAEPFISPDGRFRAVLALVFGGLYFLVLQGAENKSTTWGIDVNSKRDSALLQQTIRQLIDWAWSQPPGDGGK